ncbi:MAG: saccharopine dehydrogenase family protein [Candidatus Aminicenantales bacterium]
MNKVAVLGSGLVGGPMAVDLAREKGFRVTAVDISAQALSRFQKSKGITPLQADLSDPRTVKAIASKHDLVVSAVPGHLGFRTLRAVLEAGIDAVDIAFFPEDPFELDTLARRNRVTAVVDCGVAPGMSNILAAFASRKMDATKSITIYVGGLPEVRVWPYEYKAVFSPADVIEEYIRPARYIENGRLVIRPALSDPEFLNFPAVGTLEAFNTDGLRTLARTLDVPNMKEKTLRYPGHIDKMAVLRETGFFDAMEIEIHGVRIKPVDFTARILFPKWKLHEGEVDLTVMKIIVDGTKKGRDLRITYDLYDRYDQATKVHSMARTTGYTATLAARMIAAGLFSRKGISAPEFIGQKPGCVKFLLDGLKERGVVYRESVETLSV